MFNSNNPFEMFDFQKVLSATKLPKLDVNSAGYIDAQKKTLEAVAGASKAVFEGVNEAYQILNTRFLDGLTELKKVVSEEATKTSVKTETKN